MLFSFETEESKKKLTKKSIAVRVISTENAKIESVYNSLKSNNFQLPNQECFAQALKGFYSLKEKGLIKKEILAVVDFGLSSNLKRLWIIDMTTNEILLQSLVAHGRNTGEEFASNFSNTPESYKSSLGFYATAEVYKGKHGVSLKLDGLEKGLNHNARQRAVVIHGANYVSESFIKANKRLGRSQGCPAVPVEIAPKVIDLVKGGACLYIFHPSMNNNKKTNLFS